MPAAITLDGFDFETPSASPALELEGFDFVAPAPVSAPPSVAVPPVDDSRRKRQQRIAEFTADLNPFSGSEFGRGVAKGALGMGATTAGFGEALADLVGADSAKQWLKEKGDRLDELNAAIPQAVESFTQIRNPADVAAYTLAAIGELAPQIVTSLGAGLGLKAAGLGVKTAAVIGAAATSYPQEAGGMYRGIREETGQESPLTALGFGIPAAALDTLTPSRFLGKVFSGAAGDNLKREGWRALVKESFKEAKTTGAIEALTETSQEGIALLANKFADSTYPLLTEKNGIRMIDAGLKGLIGGTAIGGTSPSLQRLNAPQRVETGSIDDTPPTLVQKLTEAPVLTPSAPAVPQPQPTPTAVTPPVPVAPAVPTPAASANAVTVPPTVPVPVAEPTPARPAGARWQAQTPMGEATVSGVWRVSSLRDLVTSFSPSYDQTLQNRDRSRVASKEQIAKIAANLDVNRTADSPVSNTGSAFTDASNQVLSGNGRVSALRMVYDAGGRLADEYRQFVRQRAGELGMNADEVAAIPDPVLHREVTDYGGITPAKFAELSNQSDVLGMSPSEQAVSDARMLERTPELFDLFLPSEEGDVLAATNRDFLNRFINETGNQAALLKADGYNGPVLTKRVRNAMAGLLIGAEDSTLMRDFLEEAEETGIKRVADAVISSVPLMMRLRGTAYDLGPAIAQAVRDLVRIKKSGDKIYDFLSHSSLFQDPLRSDLSDTMLGYMYSAKSVKSLVGLFHGYHELARKTIDDLAGIAPPNPAPTRETTLRTAYDKTAQSTPTQKPATQEGFAFGEPQTPSGQTTRPVPGQPPPASGGQAGPLASMGPETAVTPAQDAEYLAAVQRGDTATAQRMVDDAAKRAGYTIGPVWHGTNAEFTQFEEGHAHKYSPSAGGFFLTPDREKASMYGKPRRFYVSEDTEISGDDRIARSPSQIKSAQPATYDASGAIIPLSQRFNAASPDIRYSVGAKAPAKSQTVASTKAAIAPLAARFGIAVEVLPMPPPDLGLQFANARGMAYADGGVQLFAYNIPADVNPNELFFHEVAVHLGLQIVAKTPSEKRQLDSILSSVSPRMMRDAERIAKEGGFADFNALATRYGFDMATQEGRQGAVAELLAREAQRYAAMKSPPSWWRQMLGKLKAWLGRIFKFDIGDDGVYAIITRGLSQAAGAQRSVGSNNAQTQPPLASVGPTLSQRDLEKTIAFTPDPAIQQQEAIMASGQTTGLFDVLRDKIAALASQFIPAGLSPAEQQRRMARAAFVVNITKMEGIESMAQTLGVSPQQFDAAIAAMPNDGLKTVLGHHWWSQFNLFERNARRTAAKRDAAEAKVMSRGFQQKIRNSSAQLNKADVAEQARKLLVAQLKNGLQQAQARAGQAGVNEALFATANEQIKYYSELLNRVDPIQRRMNDIIAAANTNQTLFNGIVNGTLTDPDDLLNAYLATGAALPAPGPAMVELRVAADVLARSLDLAGRMVASVASENAAIAQAVTDIESKIRHAVDARNFREVVNNVLRKVVSLSTAQGKATAIFKITQKPLIRQIELLESLEFGNAVFNAALADPVYKAMRNRANTLVGGFSRPQHALNDKGEPITPLSSPFLPEHTVYLPDGTSVVFKMYSQKAQWDAQRQSIDDTLAALTAWLANNPTTDPAHDIYRAFYQWEFDTLNTLWHASFAHDSPKMFPAFRNFHFKLIDSLLRMFDPLADSIGTRDINSAKSLAGILKDVMHQMSDWASKNSQNITHTMLVAIKSHPELTKNNALDAAGRQWFREVFNPLFASLRNPGTPGYKVNDVIASSGRKVTHEDMNAAIRQAKSTKDAMGINVVRDRLNYAMPPLIEDRVIPGAPALRGVLTLSPMMVPRRFGSAGRDVASQFINEVILGGVTPRSFWRDLNRFDHVKSMVEDRGEEYSTISTFEDAFRDAKAELQQDPSLIDDMDSLVDYMAQRINSRSTRDEIETFITAEMTRSTNAFINSIPELQQRKKGGPLPEFDFNAWEKANAFTLGRSKAVAPPSFYEYGFKDTASILNFAMSGNSFYMEQFIQSLREIADKLRKYRDDVINKRTQELTKQLGETAGLVEVRAQNREQMRLGEELLRWEKVDEYANNLDAFVKTFSELFTVGGKEVETNVRSADNWLSRLVGGILSGIVGTTRNAIDGGFFQNGTRLSRLESSTVRAFPRAAYHVLKTVIPLGLRTVPAVARGAYTAFRNIPAAVRVGMSLNPGNWLKAEGKLLGQAVDDVSNSLFGVKELNQQLKNRGIGMTVTPSETVENIGDFWRSSGVNREVVMSGNPLARLMQSVFGQFIGSAVDVQLALFVKPFFPRVGDIIANEAVSGATLGALHNFEKRFRLLADTMQRAGVTGAALANHRFTTKEVFGAFPGLGTTTEDLRFVENWFVESNIDFHRSLTDWFKRLETDPTARWLTNEEKWRLAIRSVEVVNVATALNRPLTLRANFFTRMIGLVLGWNIHAYRQMATYIGQSAKNDKSQFQIRTAIALWMLVILAAADASNEGTELLVRMLTRLMGEPERATRLPHEFESTSDQLKSHLVYAFNSVPFVANVINAAFSEQPTKAGYSPYLLIQTKIIDLINYVGGVINSGDIGYRLPQTIKGLLPISSVVLNQLPLAQGLRPAIDATRLISRYADKEDLARPFARGGPGASVNVSPLSPFGDKIISAIGRGDDAEAERLYSQAVETARRLGKPNPEASVKQLVVNRLPISRALKSTPSAAEYSRILSRMSPDQRGRVEAFTTRAEQGLARLSIETGKLRPLPPVRTTGGTRGRTARSRYSRTSRIRRVRLGGSRSRSRLGTRRRRNSLVRQAV